MLTCEYRHPWRTVRFEFDTVDTIPRILSYREHDAVTISAPPTANITIASSNDVISHAYPTNDEDASQREFELQQFVEELHPRTDRLVVVSTDRLFEGTAWSTILGIKGATEGMYTDIEGILAAACADQPSAYIGCLGNSWWFAEVENKPRALIRFSDADGSDPYATVTGIIDHLMANNELSSRRLTVFGHSVSAALLVAIQKQYIKQFDSVERFQPFRHVHATLPTDIAGKVLARSHVLGAAVGVMMMATGMVDPVALPLVAQ